MSLNLKDPLFGLGANVALVFSGQYVKFVSNMRASLAPGVDAWAVSLQYLMVGVVGAGGVLLAAYKYLQDTLVSKNKEVIAKKKQNTKKRVKMTMKESAQFLLSSTYIRDLATLVISYGMCINIVEVSWKSRLKQAFPDPNAYSAFMGNFSSATGVATLIMMLLGRAIFAKFGWRVAALVTPFVSMLSLLNVLSKIVVLPLFSTYSFLTDAWCDRTWILCHEPVCWCQ